VWTVLNETKPLMTEETETVLEPMPRTNIDLIIKVKEQGIPQWAFNLSESEWNTLHKRAPQQAVTDIKRFMNTSQWSKAKGIWDKYVTGPEPSFRPRRKSNKRKGNNRRGRNNNRGGKGKGKSPQPSPSA
jgi:hypothetical protein